jgi:hypothetical protein
MTTSCNTLLSAALLSCCCALANAGTLAINPPASVVAVNDSFNIQVAGSGFAETIVGGGFNLGFDPTVLQFTGGSVAAIWEFAPSVGTVVPVSSHLSMLTDASFATFVNSPSGNFAVATLGFKAIALGNSALVLAASPTFDFSDNAANLVLPSFAAGQVQVTAVPEPGTVAMLLAGSLLLGGLMRRRGCGRQ